jgi:glycosyltransferase involved in cell wall biosynthesis
MINTTILIPAYNEEDNIGNTLESLRALREDFNIVVIDDGSRDNTEAIAKKWATKVIKLEVNGGKGRALNEGLKYAQGDIVVFLDGDIGASAKEVTKLIKPIEDGEADFTVAVFPKAKKKGGFGFVKALAHNGVKLMTGYTTYSSLSGQRAFRHEILRGYVIDEGFGVEIGMMIDLLKKGFRLKEVPVEMSHRESERNLKGFLHRGKQFGDILRVLLKKWKVEG